MIKHDVKKFNSKLCYYFNKFEQGPPDRLFGDPQNERTKQFLHAVLDAN